MMMFSGLSGVVFFPCVVEAAGTPLLQADLESIEPYAIMGLGLQPTTKKDLRNAYFKLALQHHPDKGGDQEAFKKILNAYETIEDLIKREGAQENYIARVARAQALARAQERAAREAEAERERQASRGNFMAQEGAAAEKERQARAAFQEDLRRFQEELDELRDRFISEKTKSGKTWRNPAAGSNIPFAFEACHVFCRPGGCFNCFPEVVNMMFSGPAPSKKTRS